MKIRIQSGAKNPLDRVREDVHAHKGHPPHPLPLQRGRRVFHLQSGAGASTHARRNDLRRNAFDACGDFSELLGAVTEAVDDDPGIDADEADEIRQKWEDLKACVERFVIACERGALQTGRRNDPPARHPRHHRSADAGELPLRSASLEKIPPASISATGRTRIWDRGYLPDPTLRQVRPRGFPALGRGLVGKRRRRSSNRGGMDGFRTDQFATACTSRSAIARRCSIISAADGYLPRDSSSCDI